MFGIRKRIWLKQLRRAVIVENSLKIGIADHLITSHGYDTACNKPSDVELALFGGAVNYVLAWDIQKQLELLNGYPGGAERIQSIARQILAADPNLERLVIRLLYEIASLTHMLQREEWATEFLHNHPRIMDVLTVARPMHPELFRDVDESEFKALFECFIDKYLPRMTECRKLFS